MICVLSVSLILKSITISDGYEHDGKETSVTEAMIRGQADNLVSTGLAKAGFRLIFPDDMGFFQRDAATGRLNATTPAFPSGFKALGDHVHGKGLLWGVYSDSGTRTCGPGAGMLGHEEDDAQTFASWGVECAPSACHSATGNS